MIDQLINPLQNLFDKFNKFRQKFEGRESRNSGYGLK